MTIDREAWSGDGDFTTVLVDALARFEQIVVIKVQDAPASRADAGYNFIGNDVFVGFRVERAVGVKAVFGLVPLPVVVHRKSLTLEGLAQALDAVPGIGAPDYTGDDMLQYLRAERHIPPYQTRGVKIVEIVRIFEATPL